MGNATNKIVQMCKNLNIADGKMTDEFLFTINAVDLFYYKKNIGQVDIKTGFTDGANDGGIDFIYADGETMYLVQGKSSEDLSIENVKNVFRKILETIQNFDEKNFDHYSSVLKSAYINAYDDLSDEKNVEIVLFTNKIITETMRKQIKEFQNSSEIKDYKITVYDLNDIQLKEAILEQESDLIDFDYIDIKLNDDQKNCLSYGEDGMIVNVKASSIKRLYTKYGTKGLFSYNLREHISQKNVDDGIDSTIKNERDNFWFYNNGITIGCQDFNPDGNRIKLYGFSIINGAQTTTKLGKSKLISEKEDFVLVCKIIRAERNDKEELDEGFIGKISETSNSQKPIKQRDLKANAREQKLLQNLSANNGKFNLAIEIKRGVKPKNYKKVEKWQRVTNEYVGQLIYACLLQKPGPARNSKNTMFSSSKLYNQIFMRKHDYNTLYDLVRIGNVYDDFLADYTTKTDDLDLIAVAKNGKLTVLAVLLYLYKKQQGIVNNYLSEQVHKDNITGFLVTDYVGDDLDEKLIELFTYIIRRLKDLYETKKESMKITSYSNFFKSEVVYDIILKVFDELDNWDTQKINEYMQVFVKKKNS